MVLQEDLLLTCHTKYSRAKNNYIPEDSVLRTVSTVPPLISDRCADFFFFYFVGFMVNIFPSMYFMAKRSRTARNFFSGTEK